ncbi:hypothetical protein LOZ49_006802 [Ophidiomyces ophidiicola]|nr:hypothetical protein LOZ49_006802 [Ophidiomyces ophidiicola]
MIHPHCQTPNYSTTISEYISIQNHNKSKDSSDVLSTDEYLTACCSLDYLTSLTGHKAPDNGINPALLKKYPNQDTDNSHGVSESDWSNTLTTQSKPDFNAWLNSEDVDMLCDESAVSSADTVQNQLLVNYLTNDVLNILNVSDHKSASVYSQADASKKSATIKQTDKLSDQC